MLTKTALGCLVYARFGRSETRLSCPDKGDLVEIMRRDAGTLDTQTLAGRMKLPFPWYCKRRLSGSIEKVRNYRIEAADAFRGFGEYAGTSRTTDGRLVTAGGRVFERNRAGG